MSGSLAAMIGVGVALPACSIAGGLLLLTRVTGKGSRPPFPVPGATSRTSRSLH